MLTCIRERSVQHDEGLSDFKTFSIKITVHHSRRSYPSLRQDKHIGATLNHISFTNWNASLSTVLEMRDVMPTAFGISKIPNELRGYPGPMIVVCGIGGRVSTIRDVFVFKRMNSLELVNRRLDCQHMYGTVRYYHPSSGSRVASLCCILNPQIPDF